MKILIICSKKSYCYIKEIKDKLESFGHDVFLPNCYNNPFAEKEAWKMGEESHRQFKDSMYRQSLKTIYQVDAVLVLNLTIDNKINYIGGATFLEMYEAYMNAKKIYLYNDIPEGMLYDEIHGFSPIIIHQNLSLIKDEENKYNVSYPDDECFNCKAFDLLTEECTINCNCHLVEKE